MSAGNKAIKITAKAALKGKFTICICAALIYIFSFFICNISSTILSYIVGNNVATVFYVLLFIFLCIPILFGTLRYFWRILFDCVDNPISVFYYLSNKSRYLKVMQLVFSIFLKSLTAGLFFFIPAIAVWLVSQSFLYEVVDIAIPMWTANLKGVLVFLVNLGIIFLAFFMLKYYIAPFLLVADDNMDVAEAVYMSKTISIKSNIDFIFLIFGMLGWILLSLFVIPFIFTLPYILTVYCVHCRFAVADYNLHIGKINETKEYKVFGALD